jgi:hypothetical protein
VVGNVFELFEIMYIETIANITNTAITNVILFFDIFLLYDIKDKFGAELIMT